MADNDWHTSVNREQLAHVLRAAAQIGKAQCSASVVGIGSDLWFGIWTQADDGSFLTFVQCDELEHGLAATVNAFKDNADGVLVHPPTSDGW